MTSTHTSGSSRRILASFLVLSICAAALASAVAAPAAASANLAVAQPNEWQINESEWFINDAPTLHGGSWWGGNLADDMNPHGQPYGHGPGRHNGSSYAYVSEETGDPADHWARWDMGIREGTQELAVFVPRADASAAVRYSITSGSRSAYTDRITQRDIYGWHSLGTVTANGDRVRIEVHYNDSQTAPGLSGPTARTVGVDAMAMRCVSNCSEKPPPPPGSVRAAPHGEKSLRVTWSAPANTSGSPIRGYAVQFSRGALNNHPLHGDRDPWSSSRIAVNGTTHTSGRLLQSVTYKVAVWTVNRNGQRSRSASTANATTNGPETNVCSGGAKYTIEESGVWPFRTKRVEALRSFKTVTNSSITRGREGGKINNASSLSQSGCSWIFLRATVEDNAMVSDNAVIANGAKISDDARVYGNAVVRNRASIRDNARIYGNATIRDDAEIRNSAKIFGNAVVEDEGRAWDTAQVSANARVSDKSEVYGDAEVNGKARVYGDADVYGNAHVSGNARIIGDAHVYGNAKVYGDAEVYGKARVYGNAEVYGHAKILGDAHVFGKAIVKGNAVLSDGMKADSGVFDGRAEYIRAAKEIYSAIYQTLVSDLEECLNDRELAENTAKALLDPNAQDWERQFAEALNYGCARLRAYGEIVQVLTPGTAEMILQFGIPLGRTLRLGTYAKSLLDILSAVKDIRDLSRVSSTARQAIEDVSRALEEIGPM